MHTSDMNESIITKRVAVDIFGSQAELARQLRLRRRQNVSRWEWDEPIPRWAYLEIRYVLKPELFDENNALIKETA